MEIAAQMLQRGCQQGCGCCVRWQYDQRGMRVLNEHRRSRAQQTDCFAREVFIDHSFLPAVRTKRAIVTEVQTQLFSGAHGLGGAKSGPSFSTGNRADTEHGASHQEIRPMMMPYSSDTKTPAGISGGTPTFEALSYPELWDAWANSDDARLVAHVAALRARYEVPAWAWEGVEWKDGRLVSSSWLDELLDNPEAERAVAEDTIKRVMEKYGWSEAEARQLYGNS